ncbi:hypothetical protein [Staphylococcus delphini]|uniref:hypothetical protein n=2 Tax=Staphylococcus delphini TaxID=53344 RepID=UPI003365115F
MLNEILEYIEPLARVIGAPILVGVFLYYFTKFHTSDKDLIIRMILASLVSLFIILIPATISVFTISTVIMKSSDNVQSIIEFIAYIIIFGLIYIYMTHVQIYYLLINKFYIYKCEQNQEYALVLKGYSELRKDRIEVANKDYFNRKLKIEGCDYKAIEKLYVRRDKLLYNQDGTALDIQMLERKHLIRPWFKLNGWIVSILNFVLPLLLVIYTIFYDHIPNDILKIIVLGLIVVFTVALQTQKVIKFQTANKQFKKSYLDDINQ